MIFYIPIAKFLCSFLFKERRPARRGHRACPGGSQQIEEGVVQNQIVHAGKVRPSHRLFQGVHTGGVFGGNLGIGHVGKVAIVEIHVSDVAIRSALDPRHFGTACVDPAEVHVLNGLATAMLLDLYAHGKVIALIDDDIGKGDVLNEAAF